MGRRPSVEEQRPEAGRRRRRGTRPSEGTAQRQPPTDKPVFSFVSSRGAAAPAKATGLGPAPRRLAVRGSPSPRAPPRRPPTAPQPAAPRSPQSPEPPAARSPPGAPRSPPGAPVPPAEPGAPSSPCSPPEPSPAAEPGAPSPPAAPRAPSFCRARSPPEPAGGAISQALPALPFVPLSPSTLRRSPFGSIQPPNTAASPKALPLGGRRGRGEERGGAGRASGEEPGGAGRASGRREEPGGAGRASGEEPGARPRGGADGAVNPREDGEASVLAPGADRMAKTQLVAVWPLRLPGHSFQRHLDHVIPNPLPPPF